VKPGSALAEVLGYLVEGAALVEEQRRAVLRRGTTEVLDTAFGDRRYTGSSALVLL
jgi:hypothetical protein